MQTSTSTSAEKLTSNQCMLVTVTWVSFSPSKNQIVATFVFWVGSAVLSTTLDQLTIVAGLSSSAMRVLFLFLTTVGALNDTQECSNVSALGCFFFVLFIFIQLIFGLLP